LPSCARRLVEATERSKSYTPETKSTLEDVDGYLLRDGPGLARAGKEKGTLMDKPVMAMLWRGRRPVLMVALIVALLALFATAAYAAVFDGTSGADRFTGTPNTDRAVMKAGNDTARGLGKADFLFGNSGNDKLYGGEGSDLLNGGIDSDLLVGGTGEDELVGSYGNDTIYTGPLEDGDKVSDEVQCGDGFDVVYLSGGDHASHNTQAGKCEDINQY
jgi:Ca2+-binding RTX toxin-like protein